MPKPSPPAGAAAPVLAEARSPSARSAALDGAEESHEGAFFFKEEDLDAFSDSCLLCGCLKVIQANI